MTDLLWLALIVVGVSALFSFLVLVSPEKVAGSFDRGTFTLKGRIDQAVAEEYARAGRFETLIVDSYGGEGLAALDIANLMAQHKTVLKIKGHCMSACAEFFMPAAHRVVAIDEPIVAVHGNPILLEQLYIETGAAMPDQCALQQIGLKAIYRKMGRSTALALAQRENLVLKSFKTKFGNKIIYNPNRLQSRRVTTVR
jgi:hypothetical protein